MHAMLPDGFPFHQLNDQIIHSKGFTNGAAGAESATPIISLIITLLQCQKICPLKTFLHNTVGEPSDQK